MLARKLCSLGLALALVESVTFPAHAELLKNFKTDGSIEVRSYGIDNETDRNGLLDDYRSEIHTRLLAGGSFDLLDDVHGRFLLRKNDRIYGAAGQTIDSNTTATGVMTNVAVDNAYVKIDKLMGHVDLTFGRQFYGDPSSLVIYFGPQNNDILSVTALDTFRADADLMGWGRFVGIAGKRADAGGAVNSDTDVWGGQVDTDKVIPRGNLAGYFYTQQVKKAANVVAGNNTLEVLGFRAAGDILLGLGYEAEYIQNFGRNNGTAAAAGYDGNAYSIGLKYGQDVSNMPARFWMAYGRGTRDFATIAPGRRYGIIWGQHTSLATDVSTLNGVGGAGLTNMRIWDGGLGVNPISKLGVDINAYRFWYTTSSSNLTSAGTEYDLILSWKHSDNVSLEANAATFQVGDALQNPSTVAGTATTATTPITRLGADIKVKF